MGEVLRADHVMTKKSVMAKLEKLVNSYFNKVYKRAHMKKEDGRLGAGMSMRQLNSVRKIIISTVFQKWRSDQWDKSGATNDSLFDIGRDMESLTGDEALFY